MLVVCIGQHRSTWRTLPGAVLLRLGSRGENGSRVALPTWQASHLCSAMGDSEILIPVAMFLETISCTTFIGECASLLCSRRLMLHKSYVVFLCKDIYRVHLPVVRLL
uniref:Uncharacterized protein n=1 Tax=Spongospora subterranea TaxID=70186 RepID=A0A0H5R407_9EUKA|eukprot:CRZ08586.1 hypothetical protein [Spongospora subterranea]